MSGLPRSGKKLLFVVNVDWFFVSHRLPIALEAIRQGYEVHLASALTGDPGSLEAQGVIVHPLSLRRSSSGIAAQLGLFRQLVRLFRELRPDIVHLVTLKPVVFGGIAARLTCVPAVVAAVSGLGFVFLAQGAPAAIRRLLVALLLRLALGKRNLRVVFQNPSDRDLVASMAGLPANRCVIVPGSGVDLAHFAQQPLHAGVPLIMLAARLLGDKGVREFATAATKLKRSGTVARFCLVGVSDPDNPASIRSEELQAWRMEGLVEIWGHCANLPQVLAQSHVVVLPSYREGLPKVLIEAAACGRAIVTTDVPGCRDAIVPGVTGLLVPARDAEALALAIKTLIDDPGRCAAMGRAGRELAQARFDIALVVSSHLAIYRELEVDG